MGCGHYILDGKTPVEQPDAMKWAEWYEKIENRKVARTDLAGMTVSTVFLSIDHNYGGGGQPILYETMIFGGDHSDYQRRYHTWAEAEAGHWWTVSHLEHNIPLE